MIKTLAKFVRAGASLFFADLLLNFPKGLTRFSRGYQGTENMFYFLNSIVKARCIVTKNESKNEQQSNF